MTGVPIMDCKQAQEKYKNTRKSLKSKTILLTTWLTDANNDLDKFKDADISLVIYDVLMGKLKEHLEWMQRKVTNGSNKLI